MVIWLKKNN